MALLKVIETSPASKDNYSERGDMKIDMVILHTIQGSAKSGLNTFGNPTSKASAHYVVSKEGEIFRSVPEENNAWHAGNSFYNRRSIGIECEGFCEKEDMWTEELVDAVARLITGIHKRRRIPINRECIVGHNEVPDPHDPSKFGGVNHHTDPGEHCPWNKIIEKAKEYSRVCL